MGMQLGTSGSHPSVLMRAPVRESETERLHWLSFFALNANSVRDQLSQSVESMPSAAVDSLLEFADLHHVRHRIFEPIAEVQPVVARPISASGVRNSSIVGRAAEICDLLEKHDCPAMVMKSTDHWPDLGNDVDLFATGDLETISRVMKEKFRAVPEPQNWGDRLANKWNFRLPDLAPLVEIHIDRLGQTGS